MPKRVLAKKITRKQARSYERTTENPLGVTTIAAVNGPGAYAERYEATRALLGKSKKKRSTAKRSAAKRRTEANKRRSTAKRGTRRRTAAPKRRKAAAKRGTAKRTAKRKVGKVRKNRMGKTQYMRRMKRKGLSPKQSAALWKGYSANKRKAAPKKRKTKKRRAQKRVYGQGKYKALRARVGRKSRPTYLYRTGKGNQRKIPKHAYLGFASSAAMRAAHRKSPARADRDAARWARAQKRRDKASIRAVEGKGIFTPNRRRRPTRMKFEEWEEEMKANARRRRRKKKKTTKKRRTKRNVRRTTARRATGRKAATRRRRKSTVRRKKRTTKRRTRRNVGVTQVAANRRRRKKRKTARRRPRRNVHAKSRGYAANRRRKPKRRKARRRVRRNRGFLRNQASSWGKSLMQVLKIGGVVVVGYIAHRALSRVLSDRVLSNIGMFQSGTAAAYKDVAAGAIVAAIGVPLAATVAPGDAKMIGAGMMASLIQNAIVTVAVQMGQPQAVAYLGNYPNAEGSPQYSGYGAQGAYYEFEPGQVYSGMGEYFTTPGMSGFGQAPGGLYQAAASYGQLPQLTQQAAGFGQNMSVAQLTQAAAGMGEYIVSGGKGIGEYEEVTPQFTAPSAMDEGISPDLTSAERALSVAEAAAGVGAFGDSTVPLQSTVYPTGQPEAIPDMPGGSRAGTFAGNNGVFGAGH